MQLRFWLPAAFVLSLALPALASTGQCQCKISVISGATGLTLTSGPMRGPCGREMGVGKVAQLQLSANVAPAASALNVSASEELANVAATTQVSVVSNAYISNSVTINQGDTVTWNFDGSTHTVTANDFSFDSGFMSSGTYSHTFDQPGTFGYFCLLHGSSMSGEVIVNAVPTPEPVATILLLPAALLLGRGNRRTRAVTR